MSCFQTHITNYCRDNTTILPALPYDDDGNIYRLDVESVRRYHDYRLEKERLLVRIEEELEDEETAQNCDSYVLTIVGVPCMADVHIILLAAVHLRLIDARYRIETQYKDQLAQVYEKNCITVRYKLPRQRVYVDAVEWRDEPLRVDFAYRRKVWLGLFEAAGYPTLWGEVMNVKRINL